MDAYITGFLVSCKGIPATVFVSVLSVAIGSVVGLLIALMRTSKNRFLSGILLGFSCCETPGSKIRKIDFLNHES